MCDIMGFVRYCADTGMVFAGMGMVWKIPTHGIPVKNPMCDSSTNFAYFNS